VIPVIECIHIGIQRHRYPQKLCLNRPRLLFSASTNELKAKPITSSQACTSQLLHKKVEHGTPSHEVQDD
jgi:hypothetical protein